MLQIVHVPADEALAQRIADDLGTTRLNLEYRYTVVLLTPESVQDESILAAIESAQADDRFIIPILLSPVKLPDSINHLEPVDMSGGYRKRTLERVVRQIEVGKRRIERNNLILFGMLLVGLFMFGMAILMVGGGIATFPVDEYATELARNNAMIEAFAMPTLYGFMPRTTADAEAFPVTVEAASTRVREFLKATATALPPDGVPTQDALATVRVESTLRAYEEATATAQAEASADD